MSIHQELIRLKYCEEFRGVYGAAFQRWFEKIAVALHGNDCFLAIRETRGDGGLDGLVLREGRVYQLYAPSSLSSDARTSKKIRVDFNKAKDTLGASLKTWTFVHNSNDGKVGHLTAQMLMKLIGENSSICIEAIGIDGLWERLEKLPCEKLSVLFNMSEPQNLPRRSLNEELIHELPNSEIIEGREKECAGLLAAMREQCESRVLCFTAPGGFGKTALLIKLLNEISNNSKITEPSIRAVLHLDCRRGFRLYKVFSYLGKLIGDETSFVQLYNLSDEKLSLRDKFQKAFVELSAESARKVWILLDNFESLLNDQFEITSPELKACFQACFDGQHNVHFLVVSRYVPRFSESYTKRFKLLTSIGKSLFDGLPLKDCVTYLRRNGAGIGLTGDQESQNNLLKSFSERVYRIPLALRWAVGYLSDLNADESSSYTIADLMKRADLFEDFDNSQFQDSEDYGSKGLKRLHYEQLTKQPIEVLQVLWLLAFFNRSVPSEAFHILMDEIRLAKVLALLTKNRLVNLHESQPLGELLGEGYYASVMVTDCLPDGTIAEQRIIPFVPMKMYALHPVISDNTFFKEPLRKDNEGYFIFPDAAGGVLLLFENTADACMDIAEHAYKSQLFEYLLALTDCAGQIFMFLDEEQPGWDFGRKYARTLINKGIACRKICQRKEGLACFDEPIKILAKLVASDNGSAVENELASAYLNKSNSLDDLNNPSEALEFVDKSINP